MAFQNKEIHNAKTGQSIRFLQTSKDTHGALLEMETTYLTVSQQPVPHYHPYQMEDFKVIEGELTVWMHGAKRVLRPGDTLHMAPNTVHSMWNASTGKTVLHWKVRPALETEYLLENFAGLAADGKTDATGKPGLLQVALLMNHYSDVFRLAKPSFITQVVLFGLLMPFAYLLGYKSTYKRYLD